jgi:hypothetical protein
MSYGHLVVFATLENSFFDAYTEGVLFFGSFLFFFGYLLLSYWLFVLRNNS